jgi:hypothetical protein
MNRQTSTPSRALLATSLIVALSACGGGGGSSPPPAPSAPPGAALIGPSTYLDYSWGLVIAVDRFADVVEAMEDAFAIAIDTTNPTGPNVRTGTRPCAQGGAVTVSGDFPSITITANNCDTGTFRYNAGSINMRNPNFFTQGSTVVLGGGSFTFNNLSVTPTIPNWRLGAPNAAELFSGDLTLLYNTNTRRYTKIGSLSVSRNGRADAYTNLSVSTAPAQPAQGVDIESGNFSLASPRLNSAAAHTAAWNLTGPSTAESLTTAVDGSMVRLSSQNFDAIDPQVRYTARSNPTSNPTVDVTLNYTDASVRAAINRMLQ